MAAPAFPSFQVTGCVHHYIGYDGLSPQYLGTAEATPQVRKVKTSKPVMNDITGPVLPAQKVNTGEMAVIATPFSRWSRQTVNYLLLRSGLPRQGRFSRGILKYGINTFQLWMVFENALNTVVRSLYPGLELGFYFPQVELIEENLPRMGNTDQLWVPTFEAQPYFTPQANPTLVASGEREFWLYAQDDASFPADVLVPQ